MHFLEMEVVRLNNLLASRDEYVSFLEVELKSIEGEHAQELALKDEFIAEQSETISRLRKEKDAVREEVADARKELDEARAVILSLQGQILESNADRSQLEKDNEDQQRLTELASKAKMDFKDIVNLLQNRIFNTNSDRTRYLNGAIDLNDPLISEMGFEAIIQEVLRQTDEIIGQEGGNADKENKERLRRARLASPRSIMYSRKKFFKDSAWTPQICLKAQSLYTERTRLVVKMCGRWSCCIIRVLRRLGQSRRLDDSMSPRMIPCAASILRASLRVILLCLVWRASILIRSLAIP